MSTFESLFSNALLNNDVGELEIILDNIANIDIDKKIFQSNQYTSYCVNALQLAVVQQNLAVVKLLLESGADPNITNKNKNTPLHVAVKKKNICLIELLLIYGADVNFHNTYGMSVFHQYLQTFHDEDNMLDLFLKHGADVNAKDNNGLNVLHYAAQFNSLAVIKKLLELNVPVNDVTVDKKTPIHFVVENCVGNDKLKEIIQAFVDYGADVNAIDEDFCTPLSYATDMGDLDAVELLINFGADINGNKWNRPIFKAVEKGLVETVKFLLDHNVNIDLPYIPKVVPKDPRIPYYSYRETYTTSNASCHQKNILHVAVECIRNEKERHAIVKMLLAAGANVKEDQIVLNLAIKAKDLVLFQLFVEKGASTSVESLNKSLLVAFTNNAYDTAGILIKMGANMNQLHLQNNQSLLSYALSTKNEKMIQFLLNNGFKINDNAETVKKNKSTDLSEIVLYGRVNTIKLLALKGAITNPIEKIKSEIFYHAIDYANIEIVEYALEKGANVNEYTKYSTNLSPLSHAVQKYEAITYDSNRIKHKKLIDILLKHIAIHSIQNLCISPKNIAIIESKEYLSQNYKNYLLELKRMKKMKICKNSELTYFDLLTKRKNALINCLRCESVRTILKSGNYCEIYLHYSNHLIANYLNGCRRIKMQDILLQIFEGVLPNDIIIILSGYISDENLVNFLKK